jgi:hypothetical protein
MNWLASFAVFRTSRFCRGSENGLATGAVRLRPGGLRPPAAPGSVRPRSKATKSRMCHAEDKCTIFAEVFKGDVSKKRRQALRGGEGFLELPVEQFQLGADCAERPLDVVERVYGACVSFVHESLLDDSEEPSDCVGADWSRGGGPLL